MNQPPCTRFHCYNHQVKLISLHKKTTLIISSTHTSTDPLEYLISRGGDIFARTIYHDTPLHYAAAGGSMNCINLLLKHGADVNAPDEVFFNKKRAKSS